MSIYKGTQFIAGGSGGGSEEDNLSITKNTNNKIQTVGVIDQNDNTSAIKVWTGELADLPAVKDPTTLYNVTDDVAGGDDIYTKTEVNTLLSGKENVGVAYTKAESGSLLTTMLQTLYPVGSIYIGTQSTCPLASMIPGSTWAQVQGRYLLASGTLAGTSETYGATNTVASGAPNITGTFTAHAGVSNPTANGAFYLGDTYGNQGWNGTSTIGRWYYFTAYNSNSTYGQSGAIRSPAYVVNVWRRTA